jgi:hypothetical protein
MGSMKMTWSALKTTSGSVAHGNLSTLASALRSSVKVMLSFLRPVARCSSCLLWMTWMVSLSMVFAWWFVYHFSGRGGSLRTLLTCHVHQC